MEELDYSKKMIDGQIIFLNRICDLVQFTFRLSNGEELYLHVQCFIRIFDGEKLVICTQDMLRRSVKLKRWQRFKWDKRGGTLFDDTISEYREKLFNVRVKEVIFENNDLHILFTEDIRMDIFVHITESDDPRYSENYRIFDEDESKNHYVV